jgi:hypothetical protein
MNNSRNSCIIIPNPYLPSGKLGISFVLKIAETTKDPWLAWTLATFAMFCISAVPVGLVNVKPPPDFT